jgi:hypothetical protein
MFYIKIFKFFKLVGTYGTLTERLFLRILGKHHCYVVMHRRWTAQILQKERCKIHYIEKKIVGVKFEEHTKTCRTIF